MLFIIDFITILLGYISINGSIAWAIEMTSNGVNTCLSNIFVFSIAIIPGISMLFIVNSIIKDLVIKKQKQKEPCSFPDVTVVIPTYNEEKQIGETIESVMASDYPGKITIIVSDDASTDDTVKIAGTYPCIILKTSKEEKGNGKKAENLNRAMKQVKTELVITIDADTIVTETAIKKLVSKILESDNILAVAGNIQLKEKTETIFQKMQKWDYAIGIYSVKMAQNNLGALSVAHGACAIYKYSYFKSVGFFKEGIVGEDIKATYDLSGIPNSVIAYEPNAIFLTDSPETMKELFIQRRRWSQGAYEMIRHDPSVLIRDRVSTLFTILIPTFPIIDVCLLFVFIPSLIYSIFTYTTSSIIGMATIAIIPFSILMCYIIYKSSKKYLPSLKLDIYIIPYIVIYPIINIIANITGFIYEVVGIKKW